MTPEAERFNGWLQCGFVAAVGAYVTLGKSFQVGSNFKYQNFLNSKLLVYCKKDKLISSPN